MNQLIDRMIRLALVFFALSSQTSGAETNAPSRMIPDSLHWDKKSFQAQTVPAKFQDGNETQAARFESIPLASLGGGTTRIDDLSNPLGERLARMVEDTLAHAFGNDGKPDFPYLAQVFSGESKSILRGTAQKNAKGEESVRYAWETPRDWLIRLKTAVEQKGYRYKVNLAIIWVYQDNLDPNRFWAVVKQDWQTLDGKGKPAYRDDGFLFLNFDLVSPQPARELPALVLQLSQPQKKPTAMAADRERHPRRPGSESRIGYRFRPHRERQMGA
jgi:hypothetical protein